MMRLPTFMTEPVSSEAITSPVSRTPSPRAEMTARAIVIAIAYSVIGIVAVRSVPGIDIDQWWHMSAARWMLHHHAFPQVAIYSGLHPQPVWHDYSWLYDLMMYKLYRSFGLAGILAYITAMVLAILTALHRITGRVQADFLPAMVVAVAGILSMTPLYTPRSWLFSILFFVIQLDVLHRARSSGRWQTLLWLLPLYALWANIHIQFMDGLVVLGATACEPLFMRLWPWPEKPPLPAGKLFAILGGCIVATWINPYGWSLYFSAYKLVSERVVFNHVEELLAIPFRIWENYLFLALVVAAAVALARRQKPDLWRWMLFAGGLIISFRSGRDIWFLTAIAVMILAEGLSSKAVSAPLRPLPKLARPVIAVVVILVTFASARVMGIDKTYLKKYEYLAMPVRAVDAVMEKGYPGPIFNNYEWGGYLIWRMRKPVSIDGRAAVYGGERFKRTLDTWMGEPDWTSNPQLKAANLVIGPVNDALTQLLREDPDFRMVYRDKVAAVFVRNTTAKAAQAKKN